MSKLTTFFVSTSAGRLWQVEASSPEHASRQAPLGKGERVLEVQSKAEYDAKLHEFYKTHCRYCGELKTICGNWCRAGGMP